MGLRSFVLGSALVQGLTNVREALPTELFPGVEKPSVTLAKMLCAEMLQNLEVVGVNVEYCSEGVNEYRYRFPSFEVYVLRRPKVWANQPAYDKCVSRCHVSNGVNLKGDELAILFEGWKTFNSIEEKKRLSKAEDDRQHLALSAIETFFKPKETPCVELNPVAEKSSKTPAGPPPSALDALLSPIAS